VIGSRHYVSTQAIQDVVRAIPGTSVFVSGGAAGTDAIAEATARALGLDCLIFIAKWKRDGRAAGLIRNTRLVEAVDEVVAFWDGKSTGTLDVIRKAHQAGKKLTIYGPDCSLISPEIALGSSA